MYQVSEHWGLVWDRRACTRHSTMYKKIGGSSGMCKFSEDTVLCFRTWKIVLDMRAYTRHHIVY